MSTLALILVVIGLAVALLGHLLLGVILLGVGLILALLPTAGVRL